MSEILSTGVLACSQRRLENNGVKHTITFGPLAAGRSQCILLCLPQGEQDAAHSRLRCGRRRLGPNGLAAAITLARAGCSVLS